MCDFLLVINTNLPPISCTVSEIQRSVGPKLLYSVTHLVFNSPDEGVSWDNLRKISPGCQQIENVLKGVEILPKISIAWVGCTNVTDRRQTDGRTMTYNERELTTFAKKCWPMYSQRYRLANLWSGYVDRMLRIARIILFRQRGPYK